MLRCNACIRRTFSIVFDDAWGQPYQSVLTAAPLTSQSPSQRQPWRRSRYQSYATAASVTSQPQEYPDNLYRAKPAESTPLLRRTGGGSFTPSWRTPNSPNEAKTNEPEAPPNPTAVQNEVRWLRDPLKLADRVMGLLGDGKYFTALAVTRASSKDLQCTVSWNHLVDYNMAKGRYRDALKTYNEMKKRAQMPDARTYTTLFRGFGWCIQAKKYPWPLAETLKIYHAMFHEDSPVKPTIIHTNAVLKICAFAGDMDALFGVASKLPERGNGAPDTLTYYTILNAIRNAVRDPIRGGDARARIEAVSQGMRLWEDVKKKWIAGDLLMSEELVCAMGRLLLLGGETGADEVLSLLEQTMGVPRQVSKIGETARHGVKKLDETPLDDLLENEGSSLAAPPSRASSASESLPSIDAQASSKSVFAPIPNISKTSLVRPSRNTLSLALEACTSMELSRPAQDYWGLLTAPPDKDKSQSETYDVLPDSENYHSYLRLLRFQRASKLALSLVSDMQANLLPFYRNPQPCNQLPNAKPNTSNPASLLEPKTFRIAMSTCVRDKRNPNSLTHAIALIRIMTAALEDADARTLSTYLEFATASPHSKDDPHLLISVEREALPVWRNLRSLINYSSSSSPSTPVTMLAIDDGWSRQTSARKRNSAKLNGEVWEAGSKLMSLYNRISVTGKEKLEKAELKRVGAERARVGAFLRKMEGWAKGRKEVGDIEEGRMSFEKAGWGGGGGLVRLHYSNASRSLDNGGVGAGVVVGAARGDEGERAGAWKDPGERKLREHRGSFSFRPRATEAAEGDVLGEEAEEDEYGGVGSGVWMGGRSTRGSGTRRWG